LFDRNLAERNVIEMARLHKVRPASPERSAISAV